MYVHTYVCRSHSTTFCFEIYLQDDQSAFVRLPDDVLIRILRKLNLTTQLMMTHVHIRFLMVMPQVWRYDRSLQDFFYMYLPDCEKDAHFFLGSNQRTFKSLRLNDCAYLNVFTEHVFPNVHELFLDVKLIPDMVKSFPNLKTMKAFGEFETGKHFEEFTHLENLYCSLSFEVSNLLRILKTCKLKTLELEIFKQEQVQSIDLPFEGIQFLEVLRCNEREIKWFLKHLNNLTHLKELHITYTDQDLTKELIASVNKKSIKSLQLSRSLYIDFFEIMNVMNHFNVRIPTVVTSNIGHITNYRGLNINWEGIKELYLNHCSLNDEELNILLSSFKTPEILGLDACCCCFHYYTFDAHKIASGRRTTLHIYLNENFFKYERVSLDYNKFVQTLILFYFRRPQ